MVGVSVTVGSGVADGARVGVIVIVGNGVTVNTGITEAAGDGVLSRAGLVGRLHPITPHVRSPSAKTGSSAFSSLWRRQEIAAGRVPILGNPIP
jgi:hypothetical protein